MILTFTKQILQNLKANGVIIYSKNTHTNRKLLHIIIFTNQISLSNLHSHDEPKNQTTPKKNKVLQQKGQKEKLKILKIMTKEIMKPMMGMPKKTRKKGKSMFLTKKIKT